MPSEMLAALWFFLPAALANMAPVFAAKLFGAGRPVDAGKQWKGKPILGSHKTWQGFFWGTLLGGLFFLFQRWLFLAGYIAWNPLSYEVWWLGFLMGFGALLGDSVKSFCKRRSAVKPGARWIPWDQLDYVLGALFLTALVIPIPWQVWLPVLVIYPLGHVLSNVLGYWLGLNKHWI